MSPEKLMEQDENLPGIFHKMLCIRHPRYKFQDNLILGNMFDSSHDPLI